MSRDDSRHSGVIKTYFDEKGYGFIKPDRGGDDAFFHVSDVEAEESDLEGGQRVSFALTSGREGPQAVDVRVETARSPEPVSLDDTPLRVPRDAAPHLEDQSAIENPALRLHKAVQFEPDGSGYEVGDLPTEFPDVPSDVLDRVREEYRCMLNGQPGMEITSYERAVEWRLAIGLGRASVYENNLTLHPTYGIPYVPGSGIKGAVRSYILLSVFYEPEDEQTEARAFRDPLFRRLFGADSSAPNGARQGRVSFYDAYPTTQPTISPDIMTAHFQDYYQDGNAETPPTDDMEPNPISFLTVEDTSFAFHLGQRPRAGDPGRFDESILLERTPGSSRDSLLGVAKHWLDRTLNEHGLGAKTAVGYGFFPGE
jgi:CRISPR-associated protein Cmr6